MIKVETKGGATNISIEGQIGELLADTHIILNGLYFAIKEESEEDAEFFAHMIKNIVVDVCFNDKPKEGEGN